MPICLTYKSFWLDYTVLVHLEFAQIQDSNCQEKVEQTFVEKLGHSTKFINLLNMYEFMQVNC